MAEAEIHFNAAGTHVLVQNPATGARWDCPPDYLRVALARGWVLAEPLVEEDPLTTRTRKSRTTDGD